MAWLDRIIQYLLGVFFPHRALLLDLGKTVEAWREEVPSRFVAFHTARRQLQQRIVDMEAAGVPSEDDVRARQKEADKLHQVANGLMKVEAELGRARAEWDQLGQQAGGGWSAGAHVTEKLVARWRARLDHLGEATETVSAARDAVAEAESLYKESVRLRSACAALSHLGLVLEQANRRADLGPSNTVKEANEQLRRAMSALDTDALDDSSLRDLMALTGQIQALVAVPEVGPPAAARGLEAALVNVKSWMDAGVSDGRDRDTFDRRLSTIQQERDKLLQKRSFTPAPFEKLEADASRLWMDLQEQAHRQHNRAVDDLVAAVEEHVDLAAPTAALRHELAGLRSLTANHPTAHQARLARVRDASQRHEAELQQALGPLEAEIQAAVEPLDQRRRDLVQRCADPSLLRELQPLESKLSRAKMFTSATGAAEARRTVREAAAVLERVAPLIDAAWKTRQARVESLRAHAVSLAARMRSTGDSEAAVEVDRVRESLSATAPTDSRKVDLDGLEQSWRIAVAARAQRLRRDADRLRQRLVATRVGSLPGSPGLELPEDGSEVSLWYAAWVGLGASLLAAAPARLTELKEEARGVLDELDEALSQARFLPAGPTSLAAELEAARVEMDAALSAPESAQEGLRTLEALEALDARVQNARALCLDDRLPGGKFRREYAELRRRWLELRAQGLDHPHPRVQQRLRGLIEGLPAPSQENADALHQLEAAASLLDHLEHHSRRVAVREVVAARELVVRARRLPRERRWESRAEAALRELDGAPSVDFPSRSCRLAVLEAARSVPPPLKQAEAKVPEVAPVMPNLEASEDQRDTLDPALVAVWGLAGTGKTMVLARLATTAPPVGANWYVQPTESLKQWSANQWKLIESENRFPTKTSGNPQELVYRFRRRAGEGEEGHPLGSPVDLKLIDQMGELSRNLEGERLETFNQAAAVVLVLSATADPTELAAQLFGCVTELFLTPGAGQRDVSGRLIRPFAICLTKADTLARTVGEARFAEERPHEFVAGWMEERLGDADAKLGTMLARYRYFPVSAAGIRPHYGVVERTVFYDQNLDVRVCQGRPAFNLQAPFVWLIEQLGAK